MRTMRLPALGLLLFGLVPAASAEPMGPGMNDNTDRPGADYKSFTMDTPSPAHCQKACRAEGAACLSWTYVRPGVQSASTACYLKNGVPRAVSNGCCISGVRATVRDHRPPSAGQTGHRGTNTADGSVVEIVLAPR